MTTFELSVLIARSAKSWSRSMDEMRWMIAEQSLHEELAMERSVRSIYNTEDLEEIQGLCAARVRQNWHQRKLLSPAISKLADLAAPFTCLE